MYRPYPEFEKDGEFSPSSFVSGIKDRLQGFFQSKEKKRAGARVEGFHAAKKKDWDQFLNHASRKSFVKQLGSDPRSDAKLVMHADNMNRLKTGKKVGTVQGGSKSYSIVKLRGKDRLGCTCNDWRYKRSVAKPGEVVDCKHVRRFKQMNKTASIAGRRMLTGAAVGALGGGGIGAFADEDSRLRGAAIGSTAGTVAGTGLGYAYHKLRPVVGRMRSTSQALNNEAPMHHTRAGETIFGEVDPDYGVRLAPHIAPSGEFSEKYMDPQKGVTVDRIGDRLVAKVTPITRDEGGRQAPVMVWRTDTKSSPEEFAQEALEYARRHHTDTPGGRREFKNYGELKKEARALWGLNE